MKPHRLLLVDDHRVVREGLRAMLATEPDLTVVGEAATGAEAEALARRVPADLMVLDLALPGRSGLQVLQSLRDQGLALPVVVFTVSSTRTHAEAARRAGAQGFVGKDADPATLLRALRRALGARHSLAPSAAPKATPKQPVSLSPREQDVLRGLIAGESLRELADRLGVRPPTVSTYRQRLLDKLGLQSNVELAAWALRQGWSEPG